jgi:hypothetical protein
MKTPPFSLRIFVVDGDPDGLRVVERSNWIGKAVVFPRSLFPKVKTRDEFGQTGVYLLLGPNDDSTGELLYIGEGDPVKPRLESHFANKDFWTHAVFFVAGTGHLNKAHVKYLESQLISLAKTAKRTPLDNRNEPGEPTLSEADRADMDVFLGNLLSMLPVLGIKAFEQAAEIKVKERFAPEEWLLERSGVRLRTTGQSRELNPDVLAAARWLGVRSR